MVGGMSMGPYQGRETGELAHLRELLDRLEAGDVALADKLYCTYFMIVLLLARKVDLVTLLHQSRDAGAEVRRGQRLGKGDYLITWHRPDRPDWMDEETYAQVPEQLELRLVQVKITEWGFRTKSLNIVTTLTDPSQYCVDDLSLLYRERWNAAPTIRHLLPRPRWCYPLAAIAPTPCATTGSAIQA